MYENNKNIYYELTRLESYIISDKQSSKQRILLETNRNITLREYTIIQKIYTLNSYKYAKQKTENWKNQTNTLLQLETSILLSVINRIRKDEINMDTKFLKNTMNHFDLTDIYEKKTHTKYTFLSRARGTFTILQAIKQTLKSSKE